MSTRSFPARRTCSPWPAARSGCRPWAAGSRRRWTGDVAGAAAAAGARAGAANALGGLAAPVRDVRGGAPRGYAGCCAGRGRAGVRAGAAVVAGACPEPWCPHRCEPGVREPERPRLRPPETRDALDRGLPRSCSRLSMPKPPAVSRRWITWWWTRRWPGWPCRCPARRLPPGSGCCPADPCRRWTESGCGSSCTGTRKNASHRLRPVGADAGRGVFECGARVVDEPAHRVRRVLRRPDPGGERRVRIHEHPVWPRCRAGSSSRRSTSTPAKNSMRRRKHSSGS